MNQFPSEVHRVVNLGTFTITYGHAAAQTQKVDDMLKQPKNGHSYCTVPRFGDIGKLVSKLVARAACQAKSAPNQCSGTKVPGSTSGHGVHSHGRLEMDPAKNN